MDFGLFDYDTVECCRLLSSFQRNLPLIGKWRWYTHPKWW